LISNTEFVAENAGRQRLAALGMALAARRDRDAVLAAEIDQDLDLSGAVAARDRARNLIAPAAEVGLEALARRRVEQDPPRQQDGEALDGGRKVGGKVHLDS
jgi:hypothetical protein